MRSAKTELLEDNSGTRALLASRFDRDDGRRIAREDARQVARPNPAFNYRIRTEDAITTVADACARRGGSRTVASLELLTTQPYTGWRDPMALDLYGRANWVDRALFLAAAQRLGVREGAAAAMIGALCDAAQPWRERCTEIGFDDCEIRRLTALLRTRGDSPAA